MTDGEVLIVGGSAAPTGQGRVVGRLDPHVIVVQAPPDELAALARTGRFAIMRFPGGRTQAHGDEGVLDQLDDSARLFVDAWRARPHEKPDRPGQGLAWDAPGFQPPDLPPR